MNNFRVALFVTITVSITQLCKAQEINYPKNEISISWGVLPPPDASIVVNNFVVNMLPLPKEERDIVMTGAITGSYYRIVSEKLSFGISGSWSRVSVRYEDPDNNINWSAANVLIKCRYDYTRRTGFALYSGAAAGISFQSIRTDDSNTSPTNLGYQICGIGVRFEKKFGGFAETGFGYEGMIKAGLSLRF